VVTLVGQRVFGIALGYEDLIDHDELRHDPLMAVLAGGVARTMHPPSRMNQACRSALRFPVGAPLPRAPPCI
jgi:hypothetical protein